MPNQLAKGGYEYFTTAQMHPVNPDIRVSKRLEFKKFMRENIVPILKAQILGISDLVPRNLFVNTKTEEMTFFDCDGVSPPYLISHSVPRDQNVFKELNEWLNSEDFKRLEASHLARIQNLATRTQDIQDQSRYISSCKKRWDVIKDTVATLATSHAFLKDLTNLLLENPSRHLIDNDMGYILEMRNGKVRTETGLWDTDAFEVQLLS